MIFSCEDRKNVLRTYNEALDKYGYSSKSVLWGIEEKQIIRYEILLSFYNFDCKSIIDIGCGFGDVNKILKSKYKHYNYLGIDINENLIKKAREVYIEPYISFQTGDFINDNFSRTFDFAIASGTFNLALKSSDQYEYVDEFIRKAITVCNDGLAFNFISDRVNFRNEELFNYNPEKILSIAYKYSRNVVLRNDYMPFDFSLFIFKDESYDESRTFNRYMNLRNNY